MIHDANLLLIQGAFKECINTFSLMHHCIFFQKHAVPMHACDKTSYSCLTFVTLLCSLSSDSTITHTVLHRHLRSFVKEIIHAV